MGLLQRFARPEYRLGREGEGEGADPEPERQLDAAATQAAPPPVGESLAAPAKPSVQERGDGVNSTVPSAPHVHAGQQQPAQPAARALKVIAFANQKGGVAKTTTT